MNEERALFVMRLSIKKEQADVWEEPVAAGFVHSIGCLYDAELNVRVFNGKPGHLEQCWTFGLYNSCGTDVLTCTETCVSI